MRWCRGVRRYKGARKELEVVQRRLMWDKGEEQRWRWCRRLRRGRG